MKIIKGRGLKSSTLKSLIQSGYDRSEVEGWTKVMDTPEVSAFKHNTTPQVVIVLRGTTGTANDWSNNAVYGIGGEVAYKRTPRYKRAVARVSEIEKKYNPKDITIVGHSQGGLLAEIVPSNARERISLIRRRDQVILYLVERKRKTNMILEVNMTQ
jgi:pimeloyl-ACP methyl ester carboxylesterase